MTKKMIITNEEANHLRSTGLAIAADIRPTGTYTSEVRTTSDAEFKALNRELNTNGPYRIGK